MKENMAIGLTALLLFGLFLTMGCIDDDDDNDNDEPADDDDNDAGDDDIEDDDDAVDDDSSPIGDDDDTGDDDTGDDDTIDPDNPSDEFGVFVAMGGNDANPGTMTAPLRTVGAGIELAAQTGKVVFIAEGEYTESVNATASLYGGYQPGTWQRNEILYRTVLMHGWITPLTILAENDRLIVIDGLAVTGGEAGNDSYGIKIVNAHALLNRNVIESAMISGTSTGETIGVSIVDSEVELRDNVLVSGGIQCPGYCVADFASSYAVYSENSDLTMVHNRAISSPHSLEAFGAAGFGLSADGGNLKLAYNQFYSTTNPLANMSITIGASIANCTEAVLIGNRFHAFRSLTSCALSLFRKSDGPEMKVIAINNLFHGGGMTEYNGLISLSGMLELIMVNNIIELHSFGSDETGIYAYSSPAPATITLHNNDFYIPTGAVLLHADGQDYYTLEQVHACTWAGCAEASDNLTGDPLLYGVHNPHLTANSPCIDTGIDPSPWYDGPEIDFDFEGDARPHGAGWDIGMDEFIVR